MRQLLNLLIELIIAIAIVAVAWVTSVAILSL
jgi:hypothetical protein